LLDSETLIDDVEFERVRRIDDADTFHQFTLFVDAANILADFRFVADAAQRVRKKGAQEQRQTAGDIFIEQNSAPDNFGSGGEADTRRDRIAYRSAGEEARGDA
jgi:hypothetical protein